MEALGVWIYGKGIRKAAKATGFVLAVAWVADDLGREPTRAEFCGAYGYTERQYYRDLALFREVFERFEHPWDLLMEAEKAYRDRRRFMELPARPAVAS
jgi:hypothetical protein